MNYKLRIVHQSTPAISNLPHGDSSEEGEARYALLPINFNEITRTEACAQGRVTERSNRYKSRQGIFNSIDTVETIKRSGRRYEQIESMLITVNYGHLLSGSLYREYSENCPRYPLLPVERRDSLRWRSTACARVYPKTDMHPLTMASAVLTSKQRNRRRTSVESIRRIPKW